VKVYTSYYSATDKLPAELKQVGVSGWVPESFNGVRLKELAPKREWWMEWHSKFKDNINSKESIEWYTVKYKETVLDVVDFNEIKGRLEQLGGDVVLLCFERPGSFCHRHLIAKWLSENGLPCSEYDFSTKTEGNR